MSHIPPKGYEDAAFFGRNCHSCLRPEDGTPYEAAQKCAARLKGSYIIEEKDGWTVYMPVIDDTSIEPELPLEYQRALDAWLDTPVEKHIARWKSETAKGLRDENGKWIGGPRHETN